MLITYGKDKKHDISREKFLEIIDNIGILDCNKYNEKRLLLENKCFF